MQLPQSLFFVRFIGSHLRNYEFLILKILARSGGGHIIFLCMYVYVWDLNKGYILKTGVKSLTDIVWYVNMKMFCPVYVSILGFFWSLVLDFETWKVKYSVNINVNIMVGFIHI